MQVSACARSALVVQQVANAISTVCCFISKKHNPRDEIKIFRGSTTPRDSATELQWGFHVAGEDDEDDGDPGSGDEDVLTSLGASYRAWRVYHREKRAHDYTKSRLVEVIRREAALVKQLARVGGSVECSERILMKLEDLEAALTILEEKYDVLVTEQATREELVLRLEAVQSRYQSHTDRLHKAETDALHWKMQCQEALPELARCNLEKERLVGELRMAKKAAVLKMNRQLIQLDTTNRESHFLQCATHHPKNESKKRSYSNVEVV